jgi:hypothetical protein
VPMTLLRCAGQVSQLYSKGKYAESFYTRSLAIRQKALGPRASRCRRGAQQTWAICMTTRAVMPKPRRSDRMAAAEKRFSERRADKRERRSLTLSSSTSPTRTLLQGA